MNTATIEIQISGHITVDVKESKGLFEALQIGMSQPSAGSTEAKPRAQLVYNAEEAAKLLGVDRKTVYRLIERRLLKCVSSIRHKRIPQSEIERFLKENVTFAN